MSHDIMQYTGVSDVRQIPNRIKNVFASEAITWSMVITGIKLKIFRQYMNNFYSQVGNKTRIDQVHCLCTHLTSFGGGFIQAPNPIDFDKVFEGFKNLSDNVAVLATIVTAFAIYILMVLWLRRMDKRDELIVSWSLTFWIWLCY